MFSHAERARLRAFRRPGDQDLFRSGHLLGRVLVGRMLEVDPSSVQLLQRCEWCGGPHGCPIVRVPGRAVPRVSLSRAGGVVLSAAAFADLGVDHEPYGAAPPGVADVALAEVERAQLAQRPATEQSAALLRWWVRKEAVLKLTGHGLLVEPSSVVISAPHQPARLLGWDGPGRRPSVQIADLDIQGAEAAVAVRTRRPLRVHIDHVSLSDGLG